MAITKLIHMKVYWSNIFTVKVWPSLGNWNYVVIVRRSSWSLLKETYMECVGPMSNLNLIPKVQHTPVASHSISPFEARQQTLVADMVCPLDQPSISNNHAPLVRVTLKLKLYSLHPRSQSLWHWFGHLPMSVRTSTFSHNRMTLWTVCTDCDHRMHMCEPTQ